MQRNKGFGTVYFNKSKGVWIAAVEVPRKRGEPRRRKSFSARTREAVEMKLAEYHKANPPPARREVPRHLARAVADGHHTESEFWELVRARGRVCEYCGTMTNYRKEAARLPEALQRDHRVPLARGGSDDISNIAVACRACNQSKNTMTAAEFLEWREHNARQG